MLLLVTQQITGEVRMSLFRVSMALLLFFLPTITTKESLAKAYHSKPTVHKPKPKPAAQPKNPSISGKTTFIIYMAADNDLYPFAGRNLNQMERIGSNENINIFVHLDTRRPGHPKVTKHFIIEKGKRRQIGPDMCMDSGNPETLIYTVKLAVEHCPAEHYILDLWNHGTGPLEPMVRKAINPSYLFEYNETTKLIELNRSISFMDYITEQNEYIEPTRGICFDDSTGNYLTNEKLKYALNVCTRDHIKNKFAIIGCDACLMSMIEIASILKDFAHIMVASQEVELGTGWDYAHVLAPFIGGKPEKHQLASHIVQSYNKTYCHITHDYTQSAINLETLPLLEHNFSQVVQLLTVALKRQKNGSVKGAIKEARHEKNCTHFDEVTYIDLSHFYTNLIEKSQKFELLTPQESQEIKRNLQETLRNGCALISKMMIANTCGPNLKEAKGISIYFPQQYIHGSYRKCEFAQKTKWLEFLEIFLDKAYSSSPLNFFS